MRHFYLILLAFVALTAALSLTPTQAARRGPTGPPMQPALGWVEYDWTNPHAADPAVSFPVGTVPALGQAGRVHATYLAGDNTVKVDLASTACPALGVG